MPVIPVLPGDFHALFRAVSRLYQVPDSWEDSEKFDRALMGNAFISLVNYTGVEKAKIGPEEFGLIAAGQPDRIPLAVKAKELDYGTRTAGHILFYTLRLARHAPRLASVATAIRILERRYLLEKLPSSPGSIKTAWYKYRPVAHFVGAVSCMPEEYLELANAFPLPEGAINARLDYVRTDPDMAVKMFSDPRSAVQKLDHASAVILPRYFAFAEALRKSGEAHFAAGQNVHGHSLLDPETSWRVPEGFALPKVEIDLPPLDDDEMKAATVK